MNVLASLRVGPYFRIGENRRPRRQSRSLAVRELPRAPRFGVKNPKLLVAASRRSEDDVPPVRSPGRILVLTLARELFRSTITQIDHPDLEKPILLLVGDRATVR